MNQDLRRKDFHPGSFGSFPTRLVRTTLHRLCPGSLCSEEETPDQALRRTYGLTVKTTVEKGILVPRVLFL